MEIGQEVMPIWRNGSSENNWKMSDILMDIIQKGNKECMNTLNTAN